MVLVEVYRGAAGRVCPTANWTAARRQLDDNSTTTRRQPEDTHENNWQWQWVVAAGRIS